VFMFVYMYCSSPVLTKPTLMGKGLDGDDGACLVDIDFAPRKLMYD